METNPINLFLEDGTIVPIFIPEGFSLVSSGRSVRDDLYFDTKTEKWRDVEVTKVGVYLDSPHWHWLIARKDKRTNTHA